MKQRLKTFASVSLVVGLALFPAAGAMFQLGAALHAIDRMHREAEGASDRTVESIGTYEVNPTTNVATMRFHSVAVRR